MRTRIRLKLVLCLPLLTAPAVAPAQVAAPELVVVQPPPFENRDDNGALLYLRFEHLGGTALFERTLAADISAPDWKPDDAVRAELARTDMTDLLVRAAMSPVCRWGQDLGPGWTKLSPHLGRVRTYARILEADALAALASGDSLSAARRLRAIVHMAMQVQDDSDFVSIELGCRLVQRACERIKRAVSDVALDQRAARLLRDDLLGFPAEDPFDGVGAIRREGWSATMWLGAQTSRLTTAQIASLIDALAPRRMPNDPANLQPLPPDGAPLKADILRALPFYAAAGEAWAAPDAPQKLADLVDRARRGEFGSLFVTYVPDLAGLHAQVAKTVELVQSTSALLGMTPTKSP